MAKGRSRFGGRGTRLSLESGRFGEGRHERAWVLYCGFDVAGQRLLIALSFLRGRGLLDFRASVNFLSIKGYFVGTVQSTRLVLIIA